MDVSYIRDRITKLRLQKGVSEYKMSYDLGHSRGYINNISSGKTLPSMTEFLAICEYFEISPAAFFNERSETPRLLLQVEKQLEKLDENDLSIVMSLISRLTEEK